MKFIDPISVICPDCGHKGKHSEASLLRFEAQCEACRVTLRSVSEAMQAMMRRYRAMFDLAMLAIDIEDKFDIEFADIEMEQLFDDKSPTLNDFICVVQTKLTPDHNLHQLIYKTLTEITGVPADEAVLSKDLELAFGLID